MMVISPLNEEMYDRVQVEIGYYKLFPWLKSDFITRKDMAQIMLASNLIVSTTVTVNPGQAVTAPPPSGAGSTVSPGSGSGAGKVQAMYTGDFPWFTTEAMNAEYITKKEAGGSAAKAALGELG